ncbi:hypothetical protein ETH_00011500 [Eimeria tenella]|uniref:Alpha-amylase/branching enzyme C-terminal all beta domain-containing protein n=1 Tax=Eimeria tenella TaxID=5802 RepID=U6L3I4_EIMTE|nr:hypothetical protein ETH_00011500 [Eimeria tenella]CDJ44731.1 hypothetical protein ETH_00011500 [Eimeria tenella]|eukprot:XP_013235479.1 hypothetical protein ETH_00011500 [Eimeria tenella]
MRNEEAPYHLSMLKNIINVHHGFTKSSQCINSILGSHDQAGNRQGGQTDGKHGKYFVSLFGGRDNWHARAQCRMWYALQAVSRGLPMLFMGSENLQGDFWNVQKGKEMNWTLLHDQLATQMRALVAAANNLRLSFAELTEEQQQPAFVHENAANRVLAFTRGQLLMVLNCGEGQWDLGCTYTLMSPYSSGTNLKLIFNSQEESFGGWRGSGGPPVLQAAAGGALSLVLPKWALLVYQKL